MPLFFTYLYKKCLREWPYTVTDIFEYGVDSGNFNLTTVQKCGMIILLLKQTKKVVSDCFGIQ